MNFSIEISPSTDLDILPALKDVYITLLPGGDFKETANQAERLVKKGFNPIPHPTVIYRRMIFNSNIIYMANAPDSSNANINKNI